jgi:leucyl aminopeptidase
MPVTTLNLSTSAASTLRVDALVVGMTKVPTDAKAGRRRGVADAVAVAGAEDLVTAYRKATGTSLAQTLTALGATGVAGDVVKMSSGGAAKAPVLVAVGLGEPTQASGDDGGAAAQREVLRRAAGAALRALAGTGTVALALPAAQAPAVGAVAEGALLGAYAFHRYRSASTDSVKAPVLEVTLLVPSSRDKAVKAAVTRAEVVGAAVDLARNLVNIPPSDLPPAAFAEAARAAAKRAGVKVTVLDEKELAKGGWGGVLAVGMGSSRPPRLVQLTYSPAKATKHLALVGKGITFDTGGISLKPPKAMEWMKADMSGAAAVLAAITAIADLGLPVNVTAWAPMAENMPSGTAQRPSDVITMYGGRTVEVMNTDAEGRLVLADALVRAQEDSPDVIVDVATLTGAQMVALGSRTSAIMSNDDDLRGRVFEAAERAGEAMWPMPLPPELRKSLDSEVADISNMGDRYGGMLVAGLFLKEFIAEGARWVHLDIAGPAFNEGPAYGYTPKGGTGAAVRTLVAVAEDLAAGTI